MAPHKTPIGSWKTKATKLSCSIGLIGAFRKPCLYLRVWLRRRNKMEELRKNNPWQKIKTSPTGQTSNRICIKPSGDGKELKSIPSL